MSDVFLKRLNDDPEYFEFWEDLREYCKDLNIPDKKEFVDTIPILYKRIENDGAGYYIYEGLRNFAEKKPQEAIELLNMLEEKGIKETLVFTPSILSGISKAQTDYVFEEKVLEYLKSNNEDKVFSGIDAAYRVTFKSYQKKLKFLNDVHISLQKIIKQKSTKHLGIIVRFYNKHLNTLDGVKEVIIELLKEKKPSVQGEVARSLNEEFTPKEDLDYFKKCLNLLSYTEVKYKGIYDTIRYRLKDVIVSQPEIIIEFIENWILNNGQRLKGIIVLEGIIEELYSKHPKVIQGLFLKWLNSSNDLYKVSLQFLISNLSSAVDAVGLPKESLKKLSEIDSLYIVYMIVGYILDRKYASEMLYSILETNYKNIKIRNLIAALFVNYLIKNYYSVTEILKAKKKNANKTITSIIEQIIEASENYYKRVFDLELVNEFQPMDKRMQYFLKQQNIQMQRLMDGAEKKQPSFLDMVTNINLRTGKSFFSKYRGEYTEESEMQSFRSSLEVARVQFIDEIGQEKLRLIWQNMKRDELPN